MNLIRESNNSIIRKPLAWNLIRVKMHWGNGMCCILLNEHFDYPNFEKATNYAYSNEAIWRYNAIFMSPQMPKTAVVTFAFDALHWRIDFWKMQLTNLCLWIQFNAKLHDSMLPNQHFSFNKEIVVDVKPKIKAISSQFCIISKNYQQKCLKK